MTNFRLTARRTSIHDLLSTARFRGRRRRIWSHLVTATRVARGDDVLDVGCGNGYFTERLAATVGREGSAIGVDSSQTMIERCRRHHTSGHARYQVAHAQRLPFDDFTFDVVVSCLSFHHIAPRDRAAVVEEMFHVLRPGGRVLVADIRLPLEELRSVVAAAGFVITGAGSRPLLRFVSGIRPEFPNDTTSASAQNDSAIVPAAQIDTRLPSAPVGVLSDRVDVGLVDERRTRQHRLPASDGVAVADV